MVFTAASWMAWRCAGCSRLFRGKHCPNTFARITIPYIDSTKWKANLGVLEVTEIKTFPTWLSHPFMERLIGDSARVPRPDFILVRGRSGEQAYSISNITIIAIEPTPGWKDACQNRVLKALNHP